MQRHAPAAIFLLVLLLLIGGGIALSRGATPRVTSTGNVIVPAAWTRPAGQAAAAESAQQQQQGQAWSMPPQGQPQQQAWSMPPPAQGQPQQQATNAGLMNFLQRAPAIPPGVPPPHESRGECQSCHRILPPGQNGTAAQAAAGGPQPAGSGTVLAAGTAQAPQAMAPATRQGPVAGAIPFQEAHWQGIETVSLTPGLARVMKIPTDTQGVLIDEVTYPADELGLAGGDVILSVGRRPTPDLTAFVDAADRVRDESRVQLEVLRQGQTQQIELRAQRLGNAVGETAPMIPPGSVPPHGYMGPCTTCHRIGNNGNLPVDLGDLLTKAAPPIRPGQRRPHLDRGRCTACHQIVQ